MKPGDKEVITTRIVAADAAVFRPGRQCALADGGWYSFSQPGRLSILLQAAVANGLDSGRLIDLSARQSIQLLIDEQVEITFEKRCKEKKERGLIYWQYRVVLPKKVEKT